MLTGEQEKRIREAIDLVARTPGYGAEARELADLLRRGRIRYAPALADRALVTLTGVIKLGAEALDGPLVGLAETLVHERFHLHQNPFLKTTSFWTGVATRTPVMRRYEEPAYLAGLCFLRAIEAAFPALADVARAEQDDVAATFAAVYQAPLSGTI